MGLTAEERNPWVIPAMDAAWSRRGYIRMGCVDVTMIDESSLPDWDTSVLHYRSVFDQTDVLVWLGSMGWDTEGRDAYCDYKIFRVREGCKLPKRLYFDKVKHLSLLWSWSAPYSYNQEPFGDHLIKPDSVHWLPYKEYGFR